MSDQIRLENKKLSSITPSGATAQTDDRGAACKMQGKGWLKGGLAMAICCTVPLLLLAAIPLLGLTFGSLAGMASGLLSVVALLACPVGMYFMMRMMNNKN